MTPWSEVEPKQCQEFVNNNEVKPKSGDLIQSPKELSQISPPQKKKTPKAVILEGEDEL